MANEINFDFAGAEAAGISRQDIVREIEKSGKVKFDFAGARKAGISDDEIYAELSSRAPQQAEEDIVAGPPEDEDLPEGDVFLGELTAEPIGTPEGTTVTDDGAAALGLPPLPPKNEKEFSIVDEIVGGAEAALTLTTGATSGLVGSIVGQGAAATEQTKRRLMGDKLMTDAEYEAYAQEPAQALTYEPKTKAGQEDMAAIGKELAVFSYFAPFAVEGQAFATATKAARASGQLAIKNPLSTAVPQLVTDVDAYLRTTPLKDLAGENIHGGGLSKSARLLVARHATNPELNVDIIATVLEGVAKEDQTFVLTRFLGDKNLIKQAINGDDSVAAQLQADLVRGKLKINESLVANADVPMAMAKYGDMKAMVQAEGSTNVRVATNIVEKVDQLLAETYLIPDRGQQTALRLKGALTRSNGKMSLLEAVEYRPEINELLRKAKNHNEITNLKAIKEQLDDFISTLATPEQKLQIDDAISTYAKTMQNKEALDIIASNTGDGIGVNWTKVHRDLAEANLRTTETVDALRIAEAFSNKFGNDKTLVAMSRAKGTSADSGGLLGAWSYGINLLKDKLALYGNRHDNLKIQKAILNSIKTSKTNYDFIDTLKANKAVPEDIKADIIEALQIPYKPEAKTTGDVNLEPIVTPVGGRDMTPPTQVANDVIPPLSENQALQQSLDEIPTKPSNAAERETPYSPQSEESGVQVANEIYRQGSHLAERRIEELLGYGDRTPAETAELRTLQDHMIEAGTGHKDNIARAIDLPEDARITNGDDGYYYIELPPYNGTNVLGQSGRTPSEVRRLAEDTFGRFNIPLASNAEIKAAREGSPNIVDPGDIESFRLYQDMPRNTRVEEAISQLEQGENVTINGETFDKYHLYLNEDGEASISQPLLGAIRNSKATSAIANTEAQVLSRAEESFNALVRDIRRIERTPVSRRTVQQSAQLSELRRERLLASREVERLRNTTPNSTRFFNSFRSGNHDIEVNDRGNGSFTLNFNGKRVPISIRNSGAVSINTQDFTQGSGQGAQFYAEFYKALSAAGLKHNISGLTSVNTMRLPINIYKHKLDNGTLPIVGGQGKLQSLMQNAVNKINHIAGTDIRHMTDNQLEHLAQTTGAMGDINAGINSLKLYRKAARLLGEWRALSVVALAPLINAAYEENED